MHHELNTAAAHHSSSSNDGQPNTVLICIIVYHAYTFIVLILPAYKWLSPFAAHV